ncbi:sigma factor-like helix-turn-helix DNA-binding protein [Krasilnikovia sp. M28-CT-15]|uniref:sigma factor-like helix-turn-helix DNA-binding protein n=1 Tax=Krasilnikovia sp. M28-CT-15 TaxID=3373540 RepID=UPI003876C497
MCPRRVCPPTRRWTRRTSRRASARPGRRDRRRDPRHHRPRHFRPRHFRPRHFRPRHFRPRHFRPRHFRPRHFRRRSTRHRTRRVLIEIYFRERSIEEAAEILGIPAGTVKSRTFYALKALRERLVGRGFWTGEPATARTCPAT